jgi:small subunit ribosomal protein S1
VTKLVPFGAFVRVEEGIEGLVHISELADRHVEIPEQVVQVGDEIFVKIIDIDLDRRRISLSLKQANEGTIGEAVGDEFDPTLYGMPASYDEQGNYEYPDGFDPETGEWLPGYEKQREEWELQYAEARARFEAHRRQVEESRKAVDEEETVTAESGEGESGAGAAGSNGAPRAARGPRSGGSRPGGGAGSPGAVTSSSTPGTAATGTLASDEALAALREKLSGGQN